MSYNLKRDKKIKTLSYISYDFEGLEIKPKQHKRKNMINVSKMIVTDATLIENYIKLKVDKKLQKIFKNIIDLLNSEDDTTTTDIVNILNELNRLQSIINNKYQKFLDKHEYELLLKKIELVSVELKKRIVEIEMQKYFINEETYISNKGR